MFSSHLTVFQLITTVWGKTSKISLFRELRAQVSQIVLSAHFTILVLITAICGKKLKNLIFQWVQCTSVANRVLCSFDRFKAYYNCWSKTWKMSYLRRFRAQVSQIVLSAHFTILWLITAVWGKTWKNSYPREFSAQISQIVFFAHLTVLRLITTVWGKNLKI